MICARLPAADMIIRELDGHPVTPCLSVASRIAGDLVGVGGFGPPKRISLANGARPHMRQPGDYEHGGSDKGGSMEQPLEFRDAVLMPRLASHEQALLRSQSGPMAGAPLTSVPTSPLLQFDPQLFRILLCRLRLPLPLTSRESIHLVFCAVESAAARVCREAGARVTTNVMLRDLDPSQGPDGR